MNRENFVREVAMPFGLLRIESNKEEYLGCRVIGNAKYSSKFADDCFTISFNNDFDSTNYNCYRQEMLAKGIYLGHHIGLPARMMIDNNRIMLAADSADLKVYEKLLWSFALKYILTIASLKWDALHLKAVTLIKEGKAVLLLGRGKSGKTTLAKFLEAKGYCYCGNTHALVKDGYVWAINTWIRNRACMGNQTFKLSSANVERNAEIAQIIVVDHNNMDKFILEHMDKNTAKAFISYFSASIGNYDLKEDVADFAVKANFVERLRYLTKEQELVGSLVDNFDISYMSADVQGLESQKKIEGFFVEGIRL